MRRAALALYGLLARVVLPRRFREEYGRDLEDTVAARLASARGAVGPWLAAVAEVADLARTAMREWGTVAAGGSSSGSGGHTMRGAVMSGGWGDLRTGARNLARRPGLALGVTLTIAVGIGATTTIYSVVDGVLLRPLPYDDPNRLVAIGATTAGGSVDTGTGLHELAPMSSEVFRRFRERTRSFEQLGAMTPYSVVLSDENGLQEQVPGARVGPELFEMLGASPVLGRTFLPEEFSISTQGMEGVAMITYEYWQRRHGGDPDVLGRPLETAPSAQGPRSIIVGILPRGFQPPEPFFPPGEAPQVYAPLPTADPPPGRRIVFSMHVLGRLAPGTSLEQARSEAERISDELEVELAEVTLGPGGARRRIGLNDLHAQTVGTAGRTLWVFLGAAGFLLLLTAMNAATLFLARGLDRTQELGVRMALGAGRTQVVRLLLGEAAILSAVGGALGVALAYGGVEAFLRYAPSSIPRLGAVAVDGRVLAVAAVTCLGTGIAAGLLPALRLTGRGPWHRLQKGSRSVSEPASGLRTALVGGQLALAVVLLSGAGLLFSSFMRIRATDPGFEPDGLMAMTPAGPVRVTARLGQTGDAWQRWDPVLEALAAVPGVEAAAGASVLPFRTPTWAPGLLLPDDEPDAVREGIPGYVVTPGYLGTMGTEVVQGRGLEPSDGPDAEPVVLVNEAFVRTQLQGREAVGVVLRRTTESPGAGSGWVSMRIVGVVEDAVQSRPEDGRRSAIYVPYGQADFVQLASFSTVVRTGLPADVVAPRLRRALAETERLPRELATMWDRMSASRATPRFQTMLISAFASVALLLAAAGLHGLLAHTVRRRQRELGLRMALGADRALVLRMVLSQGMRVPVAGLALGLGGTLALSRVLASFLYDMEPHDPATLLTVAVVLMLVSVAACLAPARRATAVDPVRALQAE